MSDPRCAFEAARRPGRRVGQGTRDRSRIRARRGTVSVLALLAASLLGARPSAGATVSNVQTGTAVSTAAGTLTVSIASVDPARAFLVFETRHDSGRPVASMVRGRIASATTLEFVRVTNEATPAPVSIRWYVAEFTSGVRVQRGEVAQTSTVIDVPISAVASVEQAFVTWSKTPEPTHQNNLDGDDPMLGELTSPTNLQLRVDTVRSGIVIWWQVVEFTNAADIRVQKGTTSLTLGALSVDVTLAPADAVDVSSTFVLVGYHTSGGGNDIGSRMLRAQLVDATTIRIERDIAGNNDDIEEITWQAVELKDGSEVIRGTASLPAGTAQATVGLGGRKVDPSGAVAFASVQPAGGQNMGKTSYSADDVLGVCSVTTSLAPSLLTVDRDNTAAVCDVGWFVVQFAPTLTTAVTLTGFSATGGDGEVLLAWETGSEVNNLGFQLYRSRSEAGPWDRITDTLIPGLGSSPDGARYSYPDRDVVNGVTYFYELEDVETTGRTQRHGPVSATPRATASALPPENGAAAETAPGDVVSNAAWIRFGTPESTRLSIVERGDDHAVVELLTDGFYALPDERGAVWISIPGFDTTPEPGAPALPLRRVWLEAVAGRRVKIVSATGEDVASFESLRPAVTGEPEVQWAADGTPRAGVRPPREGASFQKAGLYPPDAARLAGVAFQAQVKKAELELSPLRWDSATGRLLLARRLTVRVVFAGREPGEVPYGGSHGRAERRGAPRPSTGVAARLAVSAPGLYGVGFEDLFGRRHQAIPATDLDLRHQGRAIAFHLEPEGRRFGPGARLYFVSAGASLNPFGEEAVYELSLAGEGVRMADTSAAPRGERVQSYQARTDWEVDRIYQPALLQAPDPWLWDPIVSPGSRDYRLDVTALAPSGGPARLVVWLQGGTDLAASPDHHVSVSVNGFVVGETSWDGKTPHRLEAEIGPGILREGESQLRVQNVADTAAPYSLVYLDRYELTYPRLLDAEEGILEGSFDASGAAEVRAVGPTAFVVDTTGPSPRWLVDQQRTVEGVGFQVEAGHRYLVVSAEAVRRPRVEVAAPPRLRDPKLRGEYVVVGPRELLEAAEPLLSSRRSQGLDSMAVALEDVYDEFGFGETSPEAIRRFLGYAYHHWDVSPRYVLLLGDGSCDYKNRLGHGELERVPPFMIRDAYLYTSSDPAYAAVDGDDSLPDLALGRLPARSLDEARALVEKVLAWEGEGFGLSGRAVLVADNSDAAGDFDGDVARLSRTVLADRNPETISVATLGSATRPAILSAFDHGASLMSYVGHGGIALWASENVFNSWDVESLAPQAQQPFLLAMDCLNGYFHHPSVSSLAEALLTAPDRGVIGAFAPSSLSVHWAANVYHEALLRELTSGRHLRLGDAVLAAQAAYVDSGARLELLGTYHLFADPAMRVR